MVAEEIRILEERTCRVCNIYKRADGIIEQHYFDDVLIDVTDIREIVENMISLTNQRKHLILVILGERNDTTLDARKMSKEFLKKYPLAHAEAIVIKSLPTRIAASFYYKIFYKPEHECRMFKNKDLAVEWLRTLHS